MPELKPRGHTEKTAAPVSKTSYFFRKDDGKLRPNGATIQRLRKQRGLSRERLAAETGIAIKTIRNLETNTNYRCNPSTLGALAQHYSVEPSVLIQSDPSTSMQLLTTIHEIIAVKRTIIASAQAVLACIGSRSTHEDLLRLIETMLEAKPDLVHYRTMSLPPFKKEFQDHLLKLLEIRAPHCHSCGSKTLHIGIYNRLAHQSESYICANETKALVMLPCASGIGNYSTAVVFHDPFLAHKYVDLARSHYQRGKTLETEQDIRSLGLMKEGDF